MVSCSPESMQGNSILKQLYTITVWADTQKTQQVAYLDVSMCFLDCFVQVKIQQSMSMMINLCAGGSSALHKT